MRSSAEITGQVVTTIRRACRGAKVAGTTRPSSKPAPDCPGRGVLSTIRTPSFVLRPLTETGQELHGGTVLSLRRACAPSGALRCHTQHHDGCIPPPCFLSSFTDDSISVMKYFRPLLQRLRELHGCTPLSPECSHPD